MLPEISSSCCHASGARRGCAGLAAVNALNGCDLLALVVVQGDPAQVAESLRRELEKTDCAQVVSMPATGIRRGISPGISLDDRAAANGRTRRGVLLWPEVEAFLRDCPERFDGLFDSIVETLATPAAENRPGSIQKAVLVGGAGLLPRVNRMVMQVPADVRFRYILVR
ncbi:MAG: hypothetical protein ACK47B_24440 [Armatimonadota bacterium]